jgi:hypothetical protein
MNPLRIPIRYVPKTLSKKDQQKQARMLVRSRNQYKNRRYITRKKVPSFKNKTSSHIVRAKKIYGIDNIRPSRELARKTGCSVSALNKIVEKGEGAYYSSGSRPNQTAKSWGYARLASSITSGKAAAVDYAILENGCDHKKRAFILARKSKKKYNYGQSSAKKRKIRITT